MQTRRLGRTENLSSVLAFGSFALFHSDAYQADRAIGEALDHGINHFDVSPIYGRAEKHIGSWIKRHGKDFFLACKTSERSGDLAWDGLQRSLDALNTDHFDLFQLHGVDDMNTLRIILGPGGAMEAVLKAKSQGLIHFIGITGHRPDVQNQALDLFDFDTVLLPLNRVHAAHRQPWNDFAPLLETARSKDLGVMAIKAVAKGVWNQPSASRPYQTWYEPFHTPADVQKSIWYTLSQDIHCAVLPGDLRLWPAIMNALEAFQPLDETAQSRIIAESVLYQPLEGPSLD